MGVTIIICTYNRAEYLKNTLEGIASAHIPFDVNIEVLIVDNNSTDATSAVAQDFINNAKIPARYCLEKRQGLSHARNRGIYEAQNEILAFTDDDIVIGKDWISNIFEIYNVDMPAAVGGKVLPLWEAPPPRWLTEEFYKYLALRDLGDEEIRLTKPRLFGANLVVLSRMFKTYGLFNTEIGRKKDKLYAGEESELIERLLRGGEKVIYAPRLAVHHVIPKKRLNKQYFRKWVFHNSELNAKNSEIHTIEIAKVPLYSLKEFALAIFKYFLAMFSQRSTFKEEIELIRVVTFIMTRLRKSSLRQLRDRR